MKLDLRAAAAAARDPLAHLSLVSGDALALFALGLLVGMIANRVWDWPNFPCWFG